MITPVKISASGLSTAPRPVPRPEPALMDRRRPG
jgi:hypothetical protein